MRTQCRGAASASLRACVVFVLAGASEGTSESKSSKCELLVDVAAPSDLVGSIFSENPS